jgi:glucoamylase
VKRYIKALEGIALKGRMMPEQIWDEPDRPDLEMYFGQPTGSAMPLMWAHAEYIKLLRSVHDGKVFDFLPAVAERYLYGKGRKDLEIWKHNRRVRTVTVGKTIRVQASSPFLLHWTLDEWKSVRDTEAASTVVDIYYADIQISRQQKSRCALSTGGRRAFGGRDFLVRVTEAVGP